MRQRSLQNGFFILLVALSTLAFFGVIRDFLMPLFWAVVLAVVFQPVHRWWMTQLGERASLAATLSLLTILVVVLLPLSLVGVAVTREALLLYERIASGELDPAEPVRRIVDFLPIANAAFESVGLDIDRLQQGLSSTVVASSGWIAQRALLIGQGAARIAIMGAIALYVLFFFFRDGAHILDGVVRALPLGEDRQRALFVRFASVSRATVGGALVVAAVQGTMGGLLFWAVGLPAPAFWGFVMTVLSFLPAVGAFLVWGPAAIILLLTGSPVRALILVLVGTLVIGIADNVLRPILVGRYARMPDFLILISTLGGLTVFGLSGIVIGPIIAAFFLAVWEMFAQQYPKPATAAASTGGTGDARREAAAPAAQPPGALVGAVPPPDPTPGGPEDSDPTTS